MDTVFCLTQYIAGQNNELGTVKKFFPLVRQTHNFGLCVWGGNQMKREGYFFY